VNTPLPTYDNLPWINSKPVSFFATVVGRHVNGEIVYDANTRFDLIPSERASAGSLFMFDCWSLASTISDSDWQSAIDDQPIIQVYSAQSGETIFRTPIPMTRQTDWSPLRMAWLPAGDPSNLTVSLSAKLSGPSLLGYSNPICRFSLLAYEITDTTFIQTILKGWSGLSSGFGSDSMQESGVRLTAGGQVLREYR